MWSQPTVPDLDATTAFWWLQQTQVQQRIQRAPLPDTLLFVDIETTRNRIVELAMVRLRRGHNPWVYHTYIDPGGDGWMRTSKHWNTRIHGLTPRMVQGWPNFPQLSAIVRQASEGATLVAHNVSFEKRYLMGELASCGHSLRAPSLDTLAIARTVLPELDDHKLDTIAAALDVRNPAPHRALGDTVTTIWALLGLLERYNGTRPLAAVVVDATRDGDGRRLNPWTR